MNFGVEKESQPGWVGFLYRSVQQTFSGAQKDASFVQPLPWKLVGAF